MGVFCKSVVFRFYVNWGLAVKASLSAFALIGANISHKKRHIAGHSNVSFFCSVLIFMLRQSSSEQEPLYERYYHKAIQFRTFWTAGYWDSEHGLYGQCHHHPQGQTSMLSQLWVLHKTDPWLQKKISYSCRDQWCLHQHHLQSAKVSLHCLRQIFPGNEPIRFPK